MTIHDSPEKELRQMRIDAWHARKQKKTDPYTRGAYIKELHLARNVLQHEEPWNKLSSQNIEVGAHLLATNYTRYLRDYICETGYFGCSIRDEAFEKVLRVQRKKSTNMGEIILCDQLIKVSHGVDKLPKRVSKGYEHIRIAAELMANKHDIELALLAEDPAKPIVHQLTDMKGNVVGESYTASRPDTLIYLPGKTQYTEALHQKLEGYYGRLTA